MARNYENTETLGNVIQQLVDKFRLGPKLLQANIVANWPKIVGEVTAQYTTDLRLEKQKLTVKLKSAALRNELMMQRSQLIENINNFYKQEIVKTLELK